MTDKKMLMKIGSMLGQLSAPVYLLDEKGSKLFPITGETVPLLQEPAIGVTLRQNGYYCRMLDTVPTMVLAVPEKTAGAKDLLCLADHLISEIFQENGGFSGKLELYRRILRHDIAGNELVEAAQESGIPYERSRSVLLFQFDGKRNMTEILSDLIPLSKEDRLLPVNRKTAVLIKDLEGMDEADELIQFAEAVQETFQEEMGLEAIIGIGDEKANLSQLSKSYLEAQKAIEVGKLFRPSEKIYDFRHLTLERLLMTVPHEEALSACHQLFNEQNAKLFSEDMLHTIETFFEKDLNLSDTARVLFVHRNTLVYRLDKIQKATGLDLRRFNDAVAFKALYELKISELPKQT